MCTKDKDQTDLHNTPNGFHSVFIWLYTICGSSPDAAKASYAFSSKLIKNRSALNHGFTCLMLNLPELYFKGRERIKKKIDSFYDSRVCFRYEFLHAPYTYTIEIKKPKWSIK